MYLHTHGNKRPVAAALQPPLLFDDDGHLPGAVRGRQSPRPLNTHVEPVLSPEPPFPPSVPLTWAVHLEHLRVSFHPCFSITFEIFMDNEPCTNSPPNHTTDDILSLHDFIKSPFTWILGIKLKC